MDHIPKISVLQSLLSITVLLASSYNIYGQDVAPQGCSYANSRADCDFLEWVPPLLDEDFKPEPFYHFSLININGTIPAGAFSGLNGPHANTDTYFDLKCINGGYTSLSRDIFTPNLHWIKNLRIYECFLENGLVSRLLENLEGLSSLYIRDGGILGPVAEDALAGLTNLQNVIFRLPVKGGTLPAGLFSGLTNLYKIEMRYTELNFIPPNWFDGLQDLQRINIYDNNLQTLPPGLFEGLTSLTYVRLYRNPWDCSCGLKWLLNWSDFTDIEDAKCEMPLSVQGDNLKDALNMLNCTPTTPNIQQTAVFSNIMITETQTTDVVTFTGTVVFMTSTPMLSTSDVSTLRQAKENDSIDHDFRNIVLLSFVGVLLLLTAVTAFLLRCGCRKYCIGGLARVNNCEEDKNGPNPQRRDETCRSLSAGLRPDEQVVNLRSY